MEEQTSKGVTGARAESVLESIGIITNRNFIPNDKGNKASGIRLGTGPISVRGISNIYVVEISEIIDTALMNLDNNELLDGLKRKVLSICKKFPVYK